MTVSTPSRVDFHSVDDDVDVLAGQITVFTSDGKCEVEDFDRDNIVTSTPRSTSVCAIREPMNPDPPAMTARESSIFVVVAMLRCVDGLACVELSRTGTQRRMNCGRVPVANTLELPDRRVQRPRSDASCSAGARKAPVGALTPVNESIVRWGRLFGLAVARARERHRERGGCVQGSERAR